MSIPFGKSGIFISVVIPVFNEKDNIRHLFEETLITLTALKRPFEIIIVDDASNDGTRDVLRELSPARIIRFRQNYGQSAAMDAGIKAASGEYLVTMDGDGQNDPADIPALLEKLEQGFDAVCGWRHQRKDPLLKKFISRGAEFLRSFLVKDNIHDAGCTLRIYKRECFEDVNLYGEMHRMIPALLRWKGFHLAEVKVNHRPRRHGITKYNWQRTIVGFLDMLYIWFWRKYAYRPLYLFGGIGLFCIAVGSGILLLMLTLRFACQYPLADKIWPLIGVFFVLAGMQLLISGILAVNIVDLKKEKSYAVTEDEKR